jgi:hypothetical protein
MSDELGGDAQHAWEMRNAYKILVGNPGGKSPLGTCRRRWEMLKT